MDQGLEITNGFTIPGSELSVKTSRSGGPGGQHVNKTSTRVSLRWHIVETTAIEGRDFFRLIDKLGHRISADGILAVHVDDTRSQSRNLEIANTRLVELVKAALVKPKQRLATKPTKGSKARSQAHKQQRSQKKQMRRKPGMDN